MIAALARLVRRAPLLIRMWWLQPNGVPRGDLALAVAPVNKQVESVSHYSAAGGAAHRWRPHQIFCGYGTEAFVIESDDEPTRTRLEEELFERHGTYEPRLFDTLVGLAERALLGLPCFLEVMLGEDSGGTHFRALRWWPPEQVRRVGDSYEVRLEAGIRNVERRSMIDAERDLGGIALSVQEQQQLVRDHIEDRILGQAHLVTMQAYAEPHRRGLRWDAARLRKVDLDARRLASARMSHLVCSSLLELRLYHGDKPAFTDHFARWQLHDRLQRLALVRDAVLAIVDVKLLGPLIERNGLAQAQLRVGDALSSQETEDIYSEAQERDLDPFAYYRRVAWPRAAVDTMRA